MLSKQKNGRSEGMRVERSREVGWLSSGTEKNVGCRKASVGSLEEWATAMRSGD
jgi:hypothetical protein